MRHQRICPFSAATATAGRLRLRFVQQELLDPVVHSFHRLVLPQVVRLELLNLVAELGPHRLELLL